MLMAWAIFDVITSAATIVLNWAGRMALLNYFNLIDGSLSIDACLAI